MKKFNCFLTGILLVLIIWLVYTIACSTVFRSQYDNDIKITTIATGKTVVDNNITISKDDFDVAMQKVAYAARQEAQDEYDKNFSILLTILAIFGIAWPVIIGWLQTKSSEKELNKMDQTIKQAAETELKIKELKKEFEIGTKNISGSFAISFEALASAHMSNVNIYANDPNNRKIAIINYITMMIYAITRHCEAGNTELAHELTMRLYKNQDSYGDMEKIDISAIKNIDSFKETLGQMHYDIFKTVYNRYFKQQLP